MKKYFFVSVVIYMFGSLLSFGQTVDNATLPSWLLYEKGKQHFREGEYGQAIRYFQDILSREITYPEAEIGLARVFREEGEFFLAERQYLKAYDQWDFLFIPEERFTIQYELSDIYRLTKLYNKYEEILRSILKEDRTFNAERSNALHTQYMSILNEEGLDKLLTLYRLDPGFYTRAHFELGVLYAKTGRYRQSVLHLTLHVLQVFSNLVEELRFFDPEFEYQNGETMLAASLKRDNLTDYIYTTNIFESLYYLGSALYAEGNGRRSFEMWDLVSGFNEAGPWAFRAEKLKASPRLEPLIVY